MKALRKFLKNSMANLVFSLDLIANPNNKNTHIITSINHSNKGISSLSKNLYVKELKIAAKT